MQKLNKCCLEFAFTMKYLKSELKNANALSSGLLNLLVSKKGNFFTLLPNNADRNKIYDFKWGGILPRDPPIEYCIEGSKEKFSPIPSIRDQVSSLILTELITHDTISCVIDDVSGSRNDNYYIHYSDAHPMFYEDEVYFHLDHIRANYELVRKCLRISNSFWHSLCILTKTDFIGIKNELTLEKIKEICLKTELFMIGAYDGEGYIFWEKSGNHFFENSNND